MLHEYFMYECALRSLRMNRKANISSKFVTTYIIHTNKHYKCRRFQNLLKYLLGYNQHFLHHP